MAGATDANWQQYSRWLYVIARTFKINTPSGGVLTAVDTCIQGFWNTTAQTGTRPWLQQDFQRKSANPTVGLSGQTPGDPTVEPTYVDVKLLEVIARDIKKIPLTAGEKTLVDNLFTATGTAKYGKTSGNVYGTTI